jgi:hypothetical protein
VDLFHQPTIVTTSGLDETLQGISTDPYGAILPSALGLRIPSVLNAGIVVPNQPRYLFLLASRILERDKTVIRGIRQGLTIGLNRSATANRVLPYEFPVTSPWWRFPDGNVSWHLVREPNDGFNPQHPLTDAPSWRYLESDQSAMLYKGAPLLREWPDGVHAAGLPGVAARTDRQSRQREGDRLPLERDERRQAEDRRQRQLPHLALRVRTPDEPRDAADGDGADSRKRVFVRHLAGGCLRRQLLGSAILAHLRRHPLR